MLEKYRTELEELLTGGYVDRYEFGFKRDGKAVWSLRYVVGPDGSLTGTGTGGGVPAGVEHRWRDVLQLPHPFGQLVPSRARARGIAVERQLPFIRADGTLPGEAGGYWTIDRTYAAGGVALERSVFRSVAA